MKTKTVSNGFGSKDVTKEEFQKYWLDYSGQMWVLFNNAGEINKYMDMQLLVEDLASKMWDSI